VCFVSSEPFLLLTVGVHPDKDCAVISNLLLASWKLKPDVNEPTDDILLPS